ncbi:MAG TPA: hypothetical protein VJT72_19780 [Pseudonocardiaceae bacterium]|nr:hypothetical protein [Pseudonocardiaceae bacterium]
MTRPNELQQLDEDLAAGRLSPEDHRRRRDELVRDAAGSAPQVASPFPPAFRWETSSPEAPTQVMPVVGQGTGGGDLAAAPQAERTDAVPSTPFYRQEPGQVRGLFQPADGPSGNNGNNSDSTAPPWASLNLPPIAEQPLAEQQSAWIRHGPEVFEAPAVQPRSKQIIGIAVLGVLVVGLMGAGVAYFLSADPAQSQGIQQPAPSQPTAAARELPAPPAPRPAPVDTPQALIEPPGADRGGGGLLDLPRLESADLLPQPILNALRAGAMTDGVLKTTIDGGNTIGMFAFAVADEQAATDVVNTIVTVQRDGGLKVDQSRAQQGLTVLGTLPGTRSTVYRGVYVLYNRAIFIEVFGSDYDAVLSTFDSLMDQQLTYAPPTVRGR